jgi:hypothetical protein
MKTPSNTSVLTLARAGVVLALISLILLSLVKVRNIRACRDNLWAILRAQDDFLDETNMAAVKVADLVPRHLKTMPVCPCGGTYSFANPSSSLGKHKMPICSTQRPRHKLQWRCGNRDWWEVILVPVVEYVSDALE